MDIGIYNPRVGIYDTGGTETFLRHIIAELADTDNITLYTGAGDVVNELATLDVNIEQVPLKTENDTLTRHLSGMTPVQPVEVESLSMFLNGVRTGLFSSIAEKDVISLHSLLDAVLVSRYTDVPTIFRVPAIDLPSWRWSLFTHIDQSTRWLTNSEWTAGQVQDGLNHSVEGVVYPGVDLRRFSPNSTSVMSFDNPVVLYVGRLDPGKGLPELIDAHATISHNRDVELLLVGDGSLRTDLKQRVMEHKTTNNVTFTGAVPHEETPHYYASADVFCLPSHSEGFGLANIEAMACGTPVVTTRVGAIPEYIKNGKNGVLVPPANAGELSSAIENLLADPAYRKELAATALADVQRFSWSNQAGMMRRHYQDVVRGSNNT